jgi:hypothetical protein
MAVVPNAVGVTVHPSPPVSNAALVSAATRTADPKPNTADTPEVVPNDATIQTSAFPT